MWEAAALAGAQEPVREAARLAVSEAVSNVVLHSYRHTDGGDFTLTVEWGADEMSVVVCDRGCGMMPRADSPGAGLGLPLIATLAHSVSVTAAPGGGTEVRMTFPLLTAG